MSIITVGIDLAKNIFAVHGVNEAGKLELVKPKVERIGDFVCYPSSCLWHTAVFILVEHLP